MSLPASYNYRLVAELWDRSHTSLPRFPGQRCSNNVCLFSNSCTATSPSAQFARGFLDDNSEVRLHCATASHGGLRLFCVPCSVSGLTCSVLLRWENARIRLLCSTGAARFTTLRHSRRALTAGAHCSCTARVGNTRCETCPCPPLCVCRVRGSAFVPNWDTRLCLNDHINPERLVSVAAFALQLEPVPRGRDCSVSLPKSFSVPLSLQCRQSSGY